MTQDDRNHGLAGEAGHRRLTRNLGYTPDRMPDFCPDGNSSILGGEAILGRESMSELELEVFAADTGTAIRIIGRVDGNSAPVLDSRLKELDLNLGLPIVLDFDDVDFVSSAGLRTMLVLAKRAEAEGGSVILARLQPEVDEVFEISGFKSIFKHHPSLETALTENGMPADLCGGASEEEPVSEPEGGLGRFVSKVLPGRSGN